MNIIYEYNSNQILYNTTINYCKNVLKIKNWKLNRNKDKKRIQEIKDYYIQNDIKTIPGIIHIWNKDSKYLVIDGIHRISAGYENNLMNIIICIYYDKNKMQIIEEFKNINKAIPVPEIYVEEYYNLKKKEIIQNVVKKLIKQYPKFVSGSLRPQKPNFNRDKLIDLLYNLNISFDDTTDSDVLSKTDQLYDILIKCNIYAKNSLRNLISSKKSEKYDFYLFNLKEHVIKEFIENNINTNDLIILNE